MENGPCVSMIYRLNMVMFHIYVEFLEAIYTYPRNWGSRADLGDLADLASFFIFLKTR